MPIPYIETQGFKIGAFKYGCHRPYGGFANTTNEYPVTQNVTFKDGSTVTYNWRSSESAFHAQKILHLIKKLEDNPTADSPFQIQILKNALQEMRDIEDRKQMLGQGAFMPRDDYDPLVNRLVSQYPHYFGNTKLDFDALCDANYHSRFASSKGIDTNTGHPYTYGFMKEVLKLKFEQHPELMRTALEMAEQGIFPVEYSNYDLNWASGNGTAQGAGMLGIAILEIANEALNAQHKTPAIRDPWDHYQKMQGQIDQQIRHDQLLKIVGYENQPAYNTGDPAIKHTSAAAVTPAKPKSVTTSTLYDDIKRDYADKSNITFKTRNGAIINATVYYDHDKIRIVGQNKQGERRAVTIDEDGNLSASYKISATAKWQAGSFDAGPGSEWCTDLRSHLQANPSGPKQTVSFSPPTPSVSDHFSKQLDQDILEAKQTIALQDNPLKSIDFEKSESPHRKNYITSVDFVTPNHMTDDERKILMQSIYLQIGPAGIKLSTDSTGNHISIQIDPKSFKKLDMGKLAAAYKSLQTKEKVEDQSNEAIDHDVDKYKHRNKYTEIVVSDKRATKDYKSKTINNASKLIAHTGITTFLRIKDFSYTENNDAKEIECIQFDFDDCSEAEYNAFEQAMKDTFADEPYGLLYNPSGKRGQSIFQIDPPELVADLSEEKINQFRVNYAKELNKTFAKDNQVIDQKIQQFDKLKTHYKQIFKRFQHFDATHKDQTIAKTESIQFDFDDPKKATLLYNILKEKGHIEKITYIPVAMGGQAAIQIDAKAFHDLDNTLIQQIVEEFQTQVPNITKSEDAVIDFSEFDDKVVIEDDPELTAKATTSPHTKGKFIPFFGPVDTDSLTPHQKNGLLIFPGNTDKHNILGKPQLLYRSNWGSGLAKAARDAFDELQMPTLSLPTKGMGQNPTAEREQQLIDDALQDIWFAIGAGYDIILPVRAHDNTTYFDESLGIDNDDPYEPSFWGENLPTPNKALAQKYIEALKEIKSFLETENAAVPETYRTAYEKGQKLDRTKINSKAPPQTLTRDNIPEDFLQEAVKKDFTTKDQKTPNIKRRQKKAQIKPNTKAQPGFKKEDWDTFCMAEQNTTEEIHTLESNPYFNSITLGENTFSINDFIESPLKNVLYFLDNNDPEAINAIVQHCPYNYLYLILHKLKFADLLFTPDNIYQEYLTKIINQVIDLHDIEKFKSLQAEFILDNIYQKMPDLFNDILSNNFQKIKSPENLIFFLESENLIYIDLYKNSFLTESFRIYFSSNNSYINENSENQKLWLNQTLKICAEGDMDLFTEALTQIMGELPDQINKGLSTSHLSSVCDSIESFYQDQMVECHPDIAAQLKVVREKLAKKSSEEPAKKLAEKPAFKFKDPQAETSDETTSHAVIHATGEDVKRSAVPPKQEAKVTYDQRTKLVTESLHKAGFTVKPPKPDGSIRGYKGKESDDHYIETNLKSGRTEGNQLELDEVDQFIVTFILANADIKEAASLKKHINECGTLDNFAKLEGGFHVKQSATHSKPPGQLMMRNIKVEGNPQFETELKARADKVGVFVEGFSKTSQHSAGKASTAKLSSQMQQQQDEAAKKQRAEQAPSVNITRRDGSPSGH